MADLKQQLRRHYDGQQLPADRVQEILAAGRKAAAARASRAWWRMAAAACVLLSLGIFGATSYFSHRAEAARLPTSAIAAAVKTYFSNPNYQLPQVSADRGVLIDWLRQNGGPANFEIPSALTGLSSYGCQVLDVNGEKVFLICFLLDPPAAETPPGTMPAKKMMTVVGPDGQMMKKTVPLVHLVVAPKGKFASPPQTGERVVLSAGGEWNFTAWTQGDQVYVAAAALPAAHLAQLVHVL